MIVLSKQPNNKRSFYTFTTTTVSFATCKRMGLYPTQNKDNGVTSTFLIKENLWLQECKWPHHLQESVAGKVTKQPLKVVKTWTSQFQATEVENEVKVVMEKEVVTKDKAEEVIALTADHTRHQLGTSREK